MMGRQRKLFPDEDEKSRISEKKVEKEWQIAYVNVNKFGYILLNFDYELSHFTWYSRIDGGWIKKVTGLNKTITNGYSLLGEFVRQGSFYFPSGLYVDCTYIKGTAKNPNKSYTLFCLHPEGKFRVIQHSQGKDWAVQLWDNIDIELQKMTEYTSRPIKIDLTIPDPKDLRVVIRSMLATFCDYDIISPTALTDQIIETIYTVLSTYKSERKLQEEAFFSGDRLTMVD